MATQSNRPSSAFKAMGQFLETNVVRKIQDLSSAASPTAIKKYFGRINSFLFGKDLIFLDTDGTVLSWCDFFQRLEGYTEKEILGQNLSIFYLPREREEQLHKKLISQAAQNNVAIQKGKWVRKDGTTFFGRMVVRSIRSIQSNELLGFTQELYTISEESD
jgi:PAS domain S-box-containing protein